MEVPKVSWDDIGGSQDLKICYHYLICLWYFIKILPYCGLIIDRKSYNKKLSCLSKILNLLQG